VLDVVVAIAIGILLGIATGLPLGVVNVAVVEAATRVGARPAIALGVGGALADGVHSALAFAGIAPLLTRYPEVRRSMVLISATLVVVYAVVVWRRREPVRAAATRETPRSIWRSIGLGASLTLPNPGALAAWVAVASAVPHERLAVGLAAAAGVTVGSAAWFTALARLAARHALDRPIARRVAQVTAALLVALAAAAVARELW